MFRDKSYNLIACAVAAVSLVAVTDGCRIDDAGMNAIPSNVISYTIGGNSLTKALADSKDESEQPADKIFELVSADGGDTIYLRRSVSEMSDDWLAEPQYVITKGAAVTRENVDQYYNNSKLYIAAFMSDGSQYIEPQAISYVSRDAETKISTWKTAKDYEWPADELHFWGWAPNGGSAGEVNPSSITNSGMTFSYSSPKGSGDFVDRDAEVQKDIILTNTITYASKSGGKAHLSFKHALSAVRFEVGKTEGCTVNAISLTVKSKGVCVYDPSLLHPIQWSNLQESKTFTQIFNAEVSEQLTDDYTVQQIDKSDDKSKTFMLIPQTASEDNKITLEVKLTINESGEQVTLKKELDESLTDWEEGMVYTYEISVVNGLEISVTDIVSGNTKTDVHISNTYSSTVKCYIRAAIIGNWYDDKGKIVEAWKVENETFQPALPASAGATVNNWTRGADGFYYYKYPVYPGNCTGQTTSDPDGDPLFTSYTAPAATVSGEELNIQIVAQGVQWDAAKNMVKEAWGEAAAEYLSIEDKASN